MPHTKTLDEVLSEIKRNEVEADLKAATDFVGDPSEELVQRAYQGLKSCIADGIRIPAYADRFIEKLARIGKYQESLDLMQPPHAKILFGNIIAEYCGVQRYDEVRKIVEILEKKGIREIVDSSTDGPRY